MDATKILSDIIAWTISYGPWIVTAAAAAAATLPAPRPGTLWATIRTAIDVLAMNFGNAKNLPKA